MDLGGRWAAAEADDDLRRSFPRPDLDDSGWQAVTVPGHWRGEPAFAGSDGPLLYRRRFETESLSPRQRAWLVMDGVFYQSDVWLDGSYLGDTEGYFFPHAFDVTDAIGARAEHLLAVEVGCERPSRRAGKRALTGVWGDDGSIDPSYNPGGIWAPVGLTVTGPVRISSLRLSCSEATPKRAVLEISCILHSAEHLTVTLRTEARLAHGDRLAADVANQQPLAVGANRVRWRLEVPSPELWWPADFGGQPLYDLTVAVDLGEERSDSRALRTGLRQVRMHNFRWLVNGEGLFLKGANLAPTRRDLACATPAEVARDVDLARQAGLNLLRARAHVGRPELYQSADQAGMLIWQDLPIHGSYRGSRRQAVRQAGKAVEVLGHHPSIVLWCGHNEPFPVGPSGPGWHPARSLWRVAAQALPDPNRSVRDRSIRRALERADPSRPVISNSGVLPSLARAASSHLYFGWYHGTERDLPRAARVWPAAARFVAEIGAQAVPRSASFMAPERWPDLDWGDLAEHYCLQKGIFDRRVPPARYPSFEAWSDATQAYQADLVRSQVEALRRLRDRPTGGFAVHCLNDAQPAVSCALLDYEREPKAAFAALQAACAPVLVTADWPAPGYPPGGTFSFNVHVINDGRQPLGPAVVEVRLAWPGGGRDWRLTGDVAAAGCTFVGRLTAVLPDLGALRAAQAAGEVGADPVWPLQLELRLRWARPVQSAANHYETVLDGSAK
jgi:beta-mannosidase